MFTFIFNWCNFVLCYSPISLLIKINCFLLIAEEQLECLANWKEGSLRYMMGRVQHQSATSDEDRYRCFAYEKVQVSSVQHGTGGSPTDRQHRSPMILLAQSGDATCSGLTSPTEGSRTLKLTKGMCALSLSLSRYPYPQSIGGSV